MSLETMTKLATTTLSTSAASVTFSNIPQHFTDLKVVYSIRDTKSDSGNAWQVLDIYFNNSTANRSQRYFFGTGSATASSNTSDIYGYSVEGSSTSNTFGNGEIYIPNYTSSNYKSISIDQVTENNATAALSWLAAGLLSDSAAITSIKFESLGTTFAQHSTFTLYGIKNARQTAGNSIKATGGNISFDGTYVVHTFPTSGTFTPSVPLIADYLVVAGGGGGGSETGSALTSGGGGAGGLRSTVTATGGGGSLESALSLTGGTAYTVTVGAGGTVPAWPNRGTAGNDSVFSTITSTGGGGGGAYNTNKNGGTGGSGGGASHPSGTGGAGTTNQGYAGGNGSSTDLEGASGGGGGAGAVGSAASVGSQANGGAGGNGVAVSISGSSVTYAGGGGGGSTGTNSASGGTGGGGAGAKGSTAGTAGTANTGGGGGGGANYSGVSRPGGAGGSGIVIVRYKG